MQARMQEVRWLKFICLSVITLGIYAVNWRLRINHERNRLLDEEQAGAVLDRRLRQAI